jgi:hypothetical protein
MKLLVVRFQFSVSSSALVGIGIGIGTQNRWHYGNDGWH